MKTGIACIVAAFLMFAGVVWYLEGIGAAIVFLATFSAVGLLALGVGKIVYHKGQ